jgi:enolase
MAVARAGAAAKGVPLYRHLGAYLCLLLPLYLVYL